MKPIRIISVTLAVLLCLSELLFIAAGSVSAAGPVVGGLLNSRNAAGTTNATTTNSISLVPTFESISVYVSFSGDGNANNQAQLSYRASGSTDWIQGMAMTVDRRATVTGGSNSYTNPYVNQWRASLIGLRPNTSYEVKVVISDPDGVSGSATLSQTISTMADSFPSTGNSYYVSPTGSDGNPGTISQPFKTIQKGVNGLKAGDTLFVRGGTYAERVVIAQRTGTVSNWITIQAYPNETPTIDGQNTQTHNLYIGGWADPKTQYVHIKGFHLTNAQTAVGINDRASNIVIDGNTIDGFVDSGVYVGAWDTANTPTNHIVIQNNNIVRNKLPGSNGGTNIGLYSNAGANIIRGNQIKDITGNPNVQSSSSHLDCIGGGPDFKMDTGLYRDTDVYNNTISDCNDDAIQADGSAMNVRIWGNTLLGIKTNWSGISTAPTIVGPLYIFRNQVTGQLTDALKQGQNSTGAQFIYHNTFYSNQASEDGFFQTDPGLKNVTAMNNILQAGRYVLEYSEASSGSGNRFNYNVIYTSDTGRFIWMNGTNLNYTGFRNLGYEGQGMQSNAVGEFVNAPGGDFHLKSGSQLAEKGVVIQGFNDARSAWAYMGSAPDLGAFELAGTTSVPASQPTATQLPKPTATLSPTQPPAATATKLPSATATSAPQPTATATPQTIAQTFEAEKMAQTSGSFQIYTDSAASAGNAIAFKSDAALSQNVTVTGTSDLIVRALGVECSALQANMIVQLDGYTLGTITMYNSPWTEFAYPKVVTPGNHTITILSSNTYSNGTCNRQIRVDAVTVK